MVHYGFVQRTVARLFLFLAVFLIGCAGAGVSPGRAPEVEGPLWPHERSDLAPDPAVVYGRLDSGFRFVLMKNHEPKDRVSIQLNIQAGSLNETEEQRGLAHFLEHMLFNGTDHFPSGELVKYFQRIGMRFGPDVNAHTGFDETVYHVLLPDGTKKSIAEGLLVMRDYADGALLYEREIKRARGVILAEKQARDSASYRTFESTFRFEMEGTLAAQRLPIGTEKTIRNADRSRLKAFYDAWYRPEKMVLVMVGDFDAKTAEALIRDRFSNFSARTREKPAPDLGMLDHRGVKPFHHYEQEAGDTTVSIEVLSSVPARNDSRALQQETLVREVAHRIVQNRLDRMLSDPDAPFTSAYVSAGRFLQKIAYGEISAKGPPETWQKRLAALEQTLRRALVHGFTPSELDRVRKEMLAELEDGVRKAPTRDSQDLSREIVRDLNRNRVFQSPVQEMEMLAPFLADLTVEEVYQALQDTWKPSHRLVLVTGNAQVESSLAGPEETIQAAFFASRRQDVAPPEESRAAAFPFFAPPTAGAKSPEISRIDDLDILQVDFGNGVRLNVKQTDFKTGEVKIHAAFGYGDSEEPAVLPALAEVSQGVVTESGMGPLTRDELDRALAGKSTSFDFKVKEDHFLFEGNSVPEELELAFQLLYGYMTAPVYRPEALALSRQRLKQRYEKLSRSIDGQFQIEGKRFLSGGDSRFAVPDPQALDRVTLEDIRGWLGSAVENAALEVSVVGDIDPERVVALAGRYLGALDPRIKSARQRTEEVRFPAGESKTVSVDTAIVKSLVVVAWPTDDFWDIHRTRRLSVLGSVLSEKLRERIRERLGVAYSPYAYNDPSRAFKGYGLLQAVVPTDPEAVRAVVDEVHKIAEDLASETLPEEQVQRVMEPILTSLKDLRRTNRYWMDSVLVGSLRHPGQLDWARTIEEDYRSIGADDIQRIARTYLDNSKSAKLVIVPAD
jgi:zinc protease